eukprot:8447971-Lingulodinium_polyedra.AAC.1
MTHRTGVMLLSLCSCMCRLPSTLSRFLFIALLTMEIVPQATLDVAWTVLVWAFEALLSGTFPATDHLGQAWPDSSPRAAQAGRAFA